ncbi:PHP domain-containing protein [Algiphilus sp.]|uniref:PHP domain-containing protein n=1 Tax=Algiphilus sp. TaxID=1872431 RepID=UPI0032EF700C
MDRTLQDRATGACDYHVHSDRSDGVLAVDALVARLAAHGVQEWALTDHDTVDGLPAATQASAAHGLRLLPGVELSCTFNAHTVHVVGLAIDPASAPLQRVLQRLDAQRQSRAEQIAQRLSATGVADAWAHTRTVAGHHRLTRTHFARMLVAQGYVRDMKAAFHRYLADGKSAAVKSAWVPLEEAVAVIHAAGGIAVLAHPLRYARTHARRRRTVAAFAEAGGDAIELSTAAQAPSGAQDQLARYAAERGLFGSLGSDFHDPAQHWIRLGQLPPLPSQVRPIWQHPRWPHSAEAAASAPSTQVAHAW